MHSNQSLTEQSGVTDVWQPARLSGMPRPASTTVPRRAKLSRLPLHSSAPEHREGLDQKLWCPLGLCHLVTLDDWGARGRERAGLQTAPRPKKPLRPLGLPLAWRPPRRVRFLLFCSGASYHFGVLSGTASLNGPLW